MSNITDRVAYLKGLAEGMKVSDETAEGKLLLKTLDVLEAMAEEVASLRAAHDELEEYVESIDDDLADMEEHLFDEEDEEDEDDDEEDEDDQMVVYSCPHCGNEVTFEIDGFDFEEENLCPACGKPLFPTDGDEEDEKK